MRAVTYMVIAVAAACGDDAGGKQTDAAVDSTLPGCTPGTQAISTVYLNFSGPAYTPASPPDDATTNTSSVLDMPRTLAPWPGTNAAEITTCFQAGLKPFRISVTDVDPGTAPHHEVIFTDTFWGGASVGSVSLRM